MPTCGLLWAPVAITLVLLVVTAPVGHHCQEPPQPPAYTIYEFIHPTFDMARSLHDFKEDKARPILKASNADSVQRFNTTLVGFRESDGDTQGLDALSSSMTSLPIPENGFNLSVISYESERARLRAYIANGQLRWHEHRHSCHDHMVSRAFEIWKPLEDVSQAMALDQGLGACFIQYSDSQAVVRGQEFTTGPVRFSKLIGSTFASRYKIASMWMYARATSFDQVRFYDEAGYEYALNLDKGSKEWTAVEWIKSLSAIPLEEPEDGFRFETSHASEAAKRDVMALKDANNPDPIGNLRMHFDHAFVEAITAYNGTICYSRGTGSNPRFKLVSCLGPTGRAPLVPKSVLDYKQNQVSVRALETYDFDGRFYLHMNYARWLSSRNTINTEGVWYLYCVTGSADALRAAAFEPGVKEPHIKEPCSYTRMSNNMMPTDIIFVPACARLVVLYQHMITLHDPTRPMDTANPQAPKPQYMVVDWMNFPLNAVLYSQERLYLFNSGNELMISGKLDTQARECGLMVDAARFAATTEYTQSQLLLRYDDELHRTRRADLLPVYNSHNYRMSDGQVNGTASWRQSLTSAASLKADLALPVNEADRDPGPDPPAPTPGPGPGPGPTPKPKPAPGNSTSIIIVIIIVIIIIGIVCGSVYYFCCGTPDEPIRRPKSAMRKLKTLSGGQQQQQQQQQKANASGAPPASTITAQDTVRSGLHALGSKASSQGKKSTKLKTVEAAAAGAAVGAAVAVAASKTADTAPVSQSASRSASASTTAPKPKSAAAPPSPLSLKSLKSMKSRRSPGPASSPKTKSKGATTSAGSSKRRSPKPSGGSSPARTKSAASPGPSSAASKKSSPGPSLGSKKSSPGANLATKKSSPAMPAASSLSKRSVGSPNSPKPSPK